MRNVVMEPEVYQGQFGNFTITASDRTGVRIYRASLIFSALSFALGSGLFLWQGNTPVVMLALTVLYTCFCIGLGISLLTIHIYLIPLHRLLQSFWVIGAIASLYIGHAHPEAFALTVYNLPLTLLGVGFMFAALTGIFFKEAFCFNRLETKILMPLVPTLLLGHLFSILPMGVERGLLAVWAGLYVVFGLRKLFQALPSDIGDKSVFDYLHQQRSAHV